VPGGVFPFPLQLNPDQEGSPQASLKQNCTEYCPKFSIAQKFPRLDVHFPLEYGKRELSEVQKICNKLEL
jgi:hypothetical protein